MQMKKREKSKSHDKELNRIKKIIVKTLKKYGAKKAGIFGSYVRGEQKKNSDIDILVDLPKNLSLLDFIHIKNELENILRKKVDLVEYEAIKPIIKDRILNEEVRII